MSIVTMNPARVSVQLLDRDDLTQEQIFKLAHHIDAYEIDKQIQDNLVIDIYKLTKKGLIELLLTPKSGLTYDELSEHLARVMNFALKSINLDQCHWEIVDIKFLTQVPGQPSYIHEEDIHSAFKTE